MSTSLRLPLGTAAAGLALGYSLSRIGFSSWDEVQGMFRFDSMRLFFTFAGGVVLMALIWRVLGRFVDTSIGPRPIHRGSIWGGVIFGAGWALCGACPAIALVQLGEGQLGALATLAGIFGGNALYSIAHERWFRFTTTNSCAND